METLIPVEVEVEIVSKEPMQFWPGSEIARAAVRRVANRKPSADGVIAPGQDRDNHDDDATDRVIVALEAHDDM